MITFPSAQPAVPQMSKPLDERQTLMGDKSPKAVSKHATQKQTKANRDLQRKQQSITAKQVAGKKK
jgi:hypothetical protein